MLNKAQCVGAQGDAVPYSPGLSTGTGVPLPGVLRTALRVPQSNCRRLDGKIFGLTLIPREGRGFPVPGPAVCQKLHADPAVVGEPLDAEA